MTLQKNNIKERNKDIFVFDTNIFLTGIDFNLIEELIYTTPTIIEEIKVKKYINKNRNILNKIHVAIESKKLLIKTPSIGFIQEIEERSKLTGDFKVLSDPDKELIALTLELKETLNRNVILFTNDYTMENLCSELNLSFSPLNKEGIKSKIIWEVYCPYCKDVYKAEDLNKICDTCGSKLKRRPIK